MEGYHTQNSKTVPVGLKHLIISDPTERRKRNINDTNSIGFEMPSVGRDHINLIDWAA